MNIPTLTGIIERRILVNYTADPAIVQQILPPPFRPKVFSGKAIVGICLIRLRAIRPKGLPECIGIASENGAHRFAVEWDESGEVKEGVFIPRRDTSLWLNAVAGGRLFPGKHYKATFNVQEGEGRYHIGFKSADNTEIRIAARETDTFNSQSIFGDLATASGFFERGAIGYSPNGTRFDGMKLSTSHWKVTALEVSDVRSSFFENESLFPKGSIRFDNALLMTDVSHEWQNIAAKY